MVPTSLHVLKTTVTLWHFMVWDIISLIGTHQSSYMWYNGKRLVNSVRQHITHVGDFVRQKSGFLKTVSQVGTTDKQLKQLE